MFHKIVYVLTLGTQYADVVMHKYTMSHWLTVDSQWYIFFERAFVAQLCHKLGFFQELEGFFRRSGRLLLKSARHVTDWVARARVGIRVWFWYSSHGFQVISFNGRAKNQSGPAQNQVIQVARIPNIRTLWTHDQKLNLVAPETLFSS